MPSELSIPFNVGDDSRIAITRDPDNQVRQHVLALINTQHLERVMLPNYGVDSESLIFENDVEVQAMELTRMTHSAFADWEPGVELLYVEPDAGTAENVTKIDVLYQRRDAPDTNSKSVGVNTAIIASDGSVKDIVRG